MLIEIYGGGFVNKGAQLMLWVVAERLRRSGPGVMLCMQTSRTTRSQRRQYDIAGVVPGTPRLGKREVARNVRERVVAGFLPSAMLNAFDLVPSRACDALIDISGYAFGDKWPETTMKRFVSRAGEYTSRGKPVIMLPQMFGPFTKPGYSDHFKRVLQHAAVVYARDRISYDYASEFELYAGHVRLAPDITIFSDDLMEPRSCEERERYACIVPNARMLDKAGEQWSAQYIDILVQSAKKIVSAGLNAVLLPHETAGADEGMARRVAEAVGDSRCSVVMVHDPLGIKQTLAGAEFVVGSRFHSIVAALSSGVPAVVMGWAHKYEMLLEDFGVPELIIESDNAGSRVCGMIEMLLDPAVRESFRTRLVCAKTNMRSSNDRMWQNCLEALGLQFHNVRRADPISSL